MPGSFKGEKRFELSARERTGKKKIAEKKNCCDDVEAMHRYLEELRVWCDQLWTHFFGPGGGAPPPPPPKWP